MEKWKKVDKVAQGKKRIFKFSISLKWKLQKLFVFVFNPVLREKKPTEITI